jgi:hypothetical protein
MYWHSHGINEAADGDDYYLCENETSIYEGFGDRLQFNEPNSSVFVTFLKSRNSHDSAVMCISCESGPSYCNPHVLSVSESTLPMNLRKLLKNGRFAKVLLGADREFNNEMIDAFRMPELNCVQLAALSFIAGFEVSPYSKEFMRRVPTELLQQFHRRGCRSFDGIHMPAGAAAVDLVILWHNICRSDFINLIEEEQPGVLPFSREQENKVSNYFT